MTKKELIEMLSEVPDDAQIIMPYDTFDFIYNSEIHITNINGFYEFKGSYVLSAANVRPRIIKEDD